MDWERRQDWRDALPASVINWQEAVEQCSGDEEFLVELIGDFQEALSQGLHSIDTALTPILTEESLLQLHRAAHTIKGTAANLMANEIMTTAASLETAAKRKPESKGNEDDLRNEVLEKVQNLRLATQKFHELVILNENYKRLAENIMS